MPHLAAGCLLCYLVVGTYVYVNTTQNGYAGIADTQNINLFGKVMQYHLQDAAPAQYADITRELDAYFAGGGSNANLFLEAHPELEAHHYALAGAYATAVVKRDLVRFAVDSAQTSVTSLESSYVGSQISASGPLARPLELLQTVSVVVYRGTLLFLPCALLWLALYFWRRTRRLPVTELMGGIVLLALYDLVLTSVGGFDAYARYHAPFVPLLLLVVLGTVCACLRDGVPELRGQPAYSALVARVKQAALAADELWGEEPEDAVHGEVAQRWVEWAESAAAQRTPPINE